MERDDWGAIERKNGFSMTESGKRVLGLLLASVIFVFLFQLEVRLAGYIYPFHQSIVLIGSILMGGALAFLFTLGLRRNEKQFLHEHLHVLITLAFLTHLFVFFWYRLFITDLIFLTILFGLVFLKIASYITLSPNKFYGVGLFGGFVGALLYAISTGLYLEETLLIVAGGVLLLYALLSVRMTQMYLSLFVIAAILFGYHAYIITNSNLVTLVHCAFGETSIKAVCLDDFGITNTPVHSYPSLKERFDVYTGVIEGVGEVVRVRNDGFYNGKVVKEESFLINPVLYTEPRVPNLKYKEKSDVLLIEPSISGHQAFQRYVKNASLTGVETNTAVDAFFADAQFATYTTVPEDYQLLFGDGRRFVERTDHTYDIIDATVEAVNSDTTLFADESTSRLYSKEALSRYKEILNPGGYIVFEQFYPQGIAGDRMVVKFLTTLQEAFGVSREELKTQLLMYSWAFSLEPGSQRFATIVYREGGFSVSDYLLFDDWVSSVQSVEISGRLNPYALEIEHLSPNNETEGTIYAAFFGGQSSVISFTEEVVTDDKPFRHTITPLPFPNAHYAFFLSLVALLFLILGKLTKQFGGVIRPKLLVLSFFFSLVTFGLQYLLFYKTGATLHTNLAFFPVFLMVPLLFASIGGYAVTFLSRQYISFLMGLFVALAAFIGTTDVFGSNIILIFVSVAVLFGCSGFLFTLLLQEVADRNARSLLYGVYLFGGGVAFLTMVTLHLAIGWLATFGLVSLALLFSVFFLFRMKRALSM